VVLEVSVGTVVCLPSQVFLMVIPRRFIVMSSLRVLRALILGVACVVASSMSASAFQSADSTAAPLRIICFGAHPDDAVGRRPCGLLRDTK